jgi:hypothetical protein
MPTTRTRRTRALHADIDDYKRQELVEGPGACLLAGVGYLPAQNAATPAEQDAAVEAARADWARYGADLLAWWVGEDDRRFSAKPWIWAPRNGPGTRPWAWWAFDAPAARGEDESEAGYLERLNLWRPGERDRYAEAAHAD